ncbi:MAG: hypothetical protein ABIH69_05645 [bacterium]|nr:hypothetical protein [Candidatus Margulisiibacteriota bacterium]
MIGQGLEFCGEERKKEWVPTRDFLPIILDKNFNEELGNSDKEKIDLFEKGLANELRQDETIEQAINRIVKMAIAAEFGPSLVAAKGAKAMIETISRGILGDPELRRQALLIIDRFAHV